MGRWLLSVNAEQPRTFVSRTVNVILSGNAYSNWVSLLAGEVVHSEFLTF